MIDKYIHGNTASERSRLALMNQLINQRCIDELALDDEKLVLDVGAGTGQFTRSMAEKLPASSRVIAVELNPDQIQAAMQPSAETVYGCPIEFRIGDARQLPLKKSEIGTIDLAHTRFLLEHVRDPDTVVKAMVSAVRPGGRIVLLDDDHDLMRFWPEPEGPMPISSAQN